MGRDVLAVLRSSIFDRIWTRKRLRKTIYVSASGELELLVYGFVLKSILKFMPEHVILFLRCAVCLLQGTGLITDARQAVTKGMISIRNAG